MTGDYKLKDLSIFPADHLRTKKHLGATVTKKDRKRELGMRIE